MDGALAKKLMLDKFPKILWQNKLEGITELEGLNCDTAPSGRYDLVFAFIFNLDEMKNVILQTDKDGLLNDGGYLYLAYPQKGNKTYPEHIDRDSIFPHLGVNEDNGLVDGTTKIFHAAKVHFTSQSDISFVYHLTSQPKASHIQQDFLYPISFLLTGKEYH